MQQLHGLTDLAVALGYERTYTWHLVNAAIEATRLGIKTPEYLCPHSYVLKGGRREVFFTAEQITLASVASESSQQINRSAHDEAARLYS